MKRTRRMFPALPIAVCACLTLFVPPADAEVRCIDLNTIAQAIFGRINPTVGDIDDFSDNIPREHRIKAARIERYAAVVDTIRELVTLDYISPVKISISQAARNVISKEIPSGSEGAKRVGSLWMRRIAEDPSNSGKYTRAIRDICETSGVSYTDIRSYYAIAMEKLVFATGKKHLRGLYSNAELKNGILRPIINYYLNPTEANFNKVAETAYRSRDRAKYCQVIRDLNPSISTRVTGAMLRM